MSTFTADKNVLEILREFPRRQAQRNQGHRDVLNHLERLGIPVDDRVRGEVHQFVSELQQRRAEKRREALAHVQQTLRDISIDVLQRRRDSAKTQFARNALKRVVQRREYLAVTTSSCKPAITAQCSDTLREHSCQRVQRLPRWEDDLSIRLLSEAWRAYEGDDVAATWLYEKKLEELGHEGLIAAALFYAQRASAKAKRRNFVRVPGSRAWYPSLAYECKSDAIERLCVLLCENSHGMRWGWASDPLQYLAPWLIYVELPTGQVSFHSRKRAKGPDYPDVWDRQKASETRILRYCDSLLLQQTSNTQC